MTKKIIAVAGGTGTLGSKILKALSSDPEVSLRVLVRPNRLDDIANLKSVGVEPVEGSIGQEDKSVYDRLCKGATTVISAVQGGPDTIIDGQVALLHAARKAGVRRFIPADFVANLFRIPPGQIVPLDWRREFAAKANQIRGDVEVVHILNGGFLDRRVLFAKHIIDTTTNTAYLWGDGTQLMDWTTYKDAARYTARVATDARSVPECFQITGVSLNFNEIVKAYEHASGKRIAIKVLGSLTDLDERIALLQQEGEQRFPDYFPLMCYRSMLNGEGKLDAIMNDRYPDIIPTTISEYVEQEMA